MKSELFRLGLLLNNYDEYNDYLVYDLEVNECIMKMYYYLLSGEEERFIEFEKLYDKLSYKQKEIVKNDYNYILESRNNKDLSLKKSK
ncbi:MAG: hypothetical protein IKF19_04760 [Bacilli bacterium]|nr:hypothetical protein [Bacilli bacterium]MBR3162023.1 hypothetical protein [Bacilli bacterium]